MSITAPGRMRIPQWAVTNRTVTANDISVDDDGVETGSVRTSLTGAVVYYTVEDADGNVVIQKISTDPTQIEIHADQVTEATKGTALVKFLRADTAPLIAGGDYTFDCWVKTADGREEPIVDCGKFIVAKSKTDILNSPVPDLPQSPGAQTPQQRCFLHTWSATGTSDAVTLPGSAAMVNINYGVFPVVEDGAAVAFAVASGSRTTTGFTLTASASLNQNDTVVIWLRDRV